MVGGTTLKTDAGVAYSSETVWNWGLRSDGTYSGSSGGISTFYPIPYYQQGISMVAGRGSTIMRNVPDVAMTADNVYVVYGNGRTNTDIGGTSCAAPLWAGFTALINQQAAAVGLPPVGSLNPALYTIGKGANYINAFHDITNGNNFSGTSPSRFSAVPGYDLCTGWGTPNGPNLINLLNNPAPLIISQPQSQTVDAGASATFSVTVRGVAPLSYQWYLNAKPISRATNSTYFIDRAQSIQAGTYTVIVSNSSGSVQSDPATLSITRGTGAFGIVGVPFRYQVTADNNPNRFSVSALPSGLHFDPLAGVIFGTPTVIGIFQVFVEAKGDSGSATVAIDITIAAGAITSPASAFDVVGVPFSYQIAADNNPNRFSVSALPSGLHFDPLGGVIYGIPTVTGRFPVAVETRNYYGTASATIVIIIVPGTITSATSAAGIIGVPFGYQIEADNDPNRFSVSALPSGLHFDPLGGVIYGIPTVTGRFPVVVETRNDYGPASATVVITIVPGAIISSTSAVGKVGVPFSYQIAADNNPNRFSVSALPSGLHFDPLGGMIFGTPTVAGSYSVVVEAKNNYGFATSTVVLVIEDQIIGGGTASRPTLTISRTGDNFLLTWPAAFDGYSLEETQLQRNTWTNSSINASVQGDQKVAIIPIPSTVKFYRLRK